MHFILVLTAFLFIVGSAGPAAAQKTASVAGDSADSAAHQPAWTKHFGRQVRLLLETPDAKRQEQAMVLILRYAGQLNMDIDFEPAVPALLDLYEHAEHEGQRLLALSALEVVGGERALGRLAEHVQDEQSERVRTHTLRVLTARLQRSEERR